MNIIVRNCMISAPAGRSSGVFFDAYRNNFGGISQHNRITGCDFINISQAALQALNTNTLGDTHMSDIVAEGNRFLNCGSGYPGNGFGISFGGSGTKMVIRNNNLDSIAGIGLEIAGPSYSTMDGNTVTHSTGTTGSGLQCVPFAFNNISGNGGEQTQGNTFTNNKVLDSTNSATYILNQNNFTASGNVLYAWNTTNGGSYLPQIGSVTNSSFSGDKWTLSNSENTISSFQIFQYPGGFPKSSNINLVNETIVGATGDKSLIGLQDSANNVNFVNCTFGTHPTNIVFNDGTASNCYLSGIDAATGKTFNYGTPASSVPAAVLVRETDSANRQISFPGTTTTFLNGAGGFTTPAGGGGLAGSATATFIPWATATNTLGTAPNQMKFLTADSSANFKKVIIVGTPTDSCSLCITVSNQTWIIPY